MGSARRRPVLTKARGMPAALARLSAPMMRSSKRSMTRAAKSPANSPATSAASRYLTRFGDSGESGGKADCWITATLVRRSCRWLRSSCRATACEYCVCSVLSWAWCAAAAALAGAEALRACCSALIASSRLWIVVARSSRAGFRSLATSIASWSMTARATAFASAAACSGVDAFAVTASELVPLLMLADTRLPIVCSGATRSSGAHSTPWAWQASTRVARVLARAMRSCWSRSPAEIPESKSVAVRAVSR